MVECEGLHHDSISFGDCTLSQRLLSVNSLVRWLNRYRGEGLLVLDRFSLPSTFNHCAKGKGASDTSRKNDALLSSLPVNTQSMSPLNP